MRQVNLFMQVRLEVDGGRQHGVGYSQEHQFVGKSRGPLLRGGQHNVISSLQSSRVALAKIFFLMQAFN